MSDENQEQPASQEVSTEVSQDSKNLGLLIWIGSIFFGFIPGLIFYLVKDDDPYVKDQGREALNWGITMLFGWAAAWVLTFIVIGLLFYPVLWILNLVFCIMGAVATSKGQTFRCPFNIRLVK